MQGTCGVCVGLQRNGRRAVCWLAGVFMCARRVLAVALQHRAQVDPQSKARIRPAPLLRCVPRKLGLRTQATRFRVSDASAPAARMGRALRSTQAEKGSKNAGKRKLLGGAPLPLGDQAAPVDRVPLALMSNAVRR